MSIVVGYVATPEGRTALEAATVEAEKRATRLIVVSCSPSGTRSDSGRLEEERALDEVREGLDKRGVAHEIRQVARSRDVADDLITAAEDNDGSLIVIGLRRRSLVGKLILGVNAQRILLGASCPVLAVKPESTSKPESGAAPDLAVNPARE